MVDGIGNGPKNPQNVQNRAANIGKSAVKGGVLGAAAGMIGDLLSGKKDSIQSDTLNVKGLSIERQSQADYNYSGTVGYQGTAEYSVSGSVPAEITWEKWANGILEAQGTIIQDVPWSSSGTVEYQGSVDYQGTVDYISNHTVDYRGSQE